jgi:CP family cyanate transporter-like MFS transporter
MTLSLIAMPLIVAGWIVMKRSKTRVSQASPPSGPDKSRIEKESRSIEQTRDSSSGPIILCGMLLALLNFAFFITIGWLPTYLASVGWAPVSAGTVTSVISFVEVPAILLIPHLSDRMGGGKLIIMMSFLLISICSLAILFEPSATWMVAPVLGITFGGTFVLILAFPAQFTKQEKVGRAAGAILAIGYLGALIGPPLAGYLRDVTGSFSSTFMVMAGAGIIAACLSARFPLGPSNDRVL